MKQVRFTKALYPYQKGDIATVSDEAFANFDGKFMEEIGMAEKDVKEIQEAPQTSIPADNKKMDSKK